MSGVTPGRSDPTRDRILEVALELIADQGFAATTTREISERLGFTKAALYYHFRTKDDLLTALMAPAMDHLAALVEGAASDQGPAARRRLVVAYVTFVADHAPALRLLVQDPQVPKRMADMGATGVYDHLVRLLADDDTPDLAARSRVRAALGAVHNVYRRAAPGDDPATLAGVATAAACAVLGLRPPRPT